MTFNERLRQTCRRKNSYLAIGLDPDMDRLPGFLMDFESPLLEFNKSIINATSDLVCAYKLNTAFYEHFGVQGWRALRKTIELIPEDTLTIIDGKRGDIGNSSEKYARMAFAELNGDAATVNPYMGYDSVEPFLKEESRGAFILCLTTNPGAEDFQYLKMGDRTLFEHVAQRAVAWNRKGNVGLVVGATRSDEFRTIRAIAPELPFLVPGVGAQGGDLERAVLGAADKNGEGFVISVSRGILYVSDDLDFAQASREKTEEFRNRINKIRAKNG